MFFASPQSPQSGGSGSLATMFYGKQGPQEYAIVLNKTVPLFGGLLSFYGLMLESKHNMLVRATADINLSAAHLQNVLYPTLAMQCGSEGAGAGVIKMASWCPWYLIS